MYLTVRLSGTLMVRLLHQYRGINVKKGEMWIDSTYWGNSLPRISHRRAHKYLQ